MGVKNSKGTPNNNEKQKCWKGISSPATVGKAPQDSGKLSGGFVKGSKTQTGHSSKNPFKISK